MLAAADAHEIRRALTGRAAAGRAAWLPPLVTPKGQIPRSDDELFAVCSDLAPNPVGPDHHELGDAVITVRRGPLFERLDGRMRWRCQLVTSAHLLCDSTHFMTWGVVYYWQPPDGSWQRPRVTWGYRGGPNENNLDRAIAVFNTLNARKHTQRDRQRRAVWLSRDHEPDLNVVIDNLDRSEVAMAIARLDRRSDGRRGALLGPADTLSTRPAGQ